MNHIAGASLSCPPNSNNPKRQHFARAKKSSAAELFSNRSNRPHLPRTVRSPLPSAAATKTSPGEFNGRIFHEPRIEECFRVGYYEGKVRPPNFSATTFSATFSQKLACPNFEMCATMLLWSNLPPTHRGIASAS